ncbi:unnamed protein product [Rhizophagus irregularis]|nr:unnamed protein product [Rhizophagus irregularis]
MTYLSKAKATNVTEINSATGSNVYDEIARLNFTQELKISLFSYFTLNEKVKVNAESVLAICENDEDKFTYLNDILNSIKNSDLLEKSRSIENELVNECTTSVTDVEPSPEVDLKKFAQKLNLEQLEPDDPLKNENIKKFYEFAGPDFDWPSTSSIDERHEIYNHITSPSPKFLEGQGREIAMNLLAYRRLIESGELDDSKGNYVQIEHGKLVCCGEKISVEKYNELFKKNSGMVYAPVKHDKVIIRVFSTLDTTEKEWQVHM